MHRTQNIAIAFKPKIFKHGLKAFVFSLKNGRFLLHNTIISFLKNLFKYSSVYSLKYNVPKAISANIQMWLFFVIFWNGVLLQVLIADLRV